MNTRGRRRDAATGPHGAAGSVETTLRRARPLLGTLVEVGVRGAGASHAALDDAFAAIEEVQSQLSRFAVGSDIAAFHALPRGTGLRMRTHTARVLAASQALAVDSEGLFDISLGSAPAGWTLAHDWLVKHDNAVTLDLGGIGKGYAVDAAVDALRAHGCIAGWVNAGGDVRAFGTIAVPLRLRDETSGGVRTFATIVDGAFATSHFGSATRSRAAAPRPVHAHASVAAPLCLWADALTKVVAISGQPDHPLLTRYGARAWLH